MRRGQLERENREIEKTKKKFREKRKILMISHKEKKKIKKEIDKENKRIQ